MLSTLQSESQAISIIQDHLTQAGFGDLKVEWHSEVTTSQNSTVMKVAFKVAMGDEQRQEVVRVLRRIYRTSCQKIEYSNCSRQYQEGGDLIIAVLYAEIHEKS